MEVDDRLRVEVEHAFAEMVQGLIESEPSVTGRVNHDEDVEVGRGKDVIAL